MEKRPEVSSPGNSNGHANAAMTRKSLIGARSSKTSRTDHLINPEDLFLLPDVRVQPTLNALALLQGLDVRAEVIRVTQTRASRERQMVECVLNFPCRGRTLSRRLRDGAPWNPLNLPRLVGALFGQDLWLKLMKWDEHLVCIDGG